MRTKYGKASVCIAVVFLLLGVSIWYYAAHSSSEISIDQNTYYPVIHVMDGDTFQVQIGTKPATVRLLGIDTPETVDPRKPVQCFGKEASDETKSLVTGRTIQLKLNPHRETRDKYGRYLAYAYRDDGLFVNEFLLNGGYAREYTFGSAYSFQKEFRDDQTAAQKDGKGLWKECAQVGGK